jgi:hypothetical protein
MNCICRSALSRITICVFLLQTTGAATALAYMRDYMVPAAGGCPVVEQQNIGVSAPPLARQWSTSLPNINPPTIVTVAAAGTAAQLTEIQNTIEQAYGIWTGVTGTLVNATTFPNALGPLGETTTQNACTPDSTGNSQTGVDGIDTICFNQSSSAFTTGVLSFTRAVIAESPGEVIGSAPASVFAGQIVDADIYFRNDGQATFATPEALNSAPAAYDLESLLAHELGQLFGLDNSGVWRSVMFPFAPSPGTFVGSRPTASAPDAPLADDDRAGLRSLYSDPADIVDIGYISGRVVPANLFALADFPATSPGQYVSGMFGTQVVAVNAATGSVFAATLGGWTCNPSTSIVQFDGSYTLGPLPIGQSYVIYAEPFVGLVQASDIASATSGVCSSGSSPSCTVPAVNTNFAPRVQQ